jgi:hypothetical protein
MNKTVLYVLHGALLTVFTSCGEALMDSTVNTGMPIVESYLTEGANTVTVKVYSMEVYLKDGYEFSMPVGGLKPNINGIEMEETAAGTYSLNLGADTVRGLQQYDLSFDYLGTTVSASTSVPQPVTNLRVEPAYIEHAALSYYYFDMTADTVEIKLTWDDPGLDYYQIYIESPAATDMPSMGGDMQFRRRMMQPFRGGSYTTTSREFRTAGYYSIYVYRVNKDYADLYELTGSTDLAGPSSAVRNAFGIFTAMSVAGVRFQVIETED